MGEWQKIETASRDGTSMWGYSSKYDEWFEVRFGNLATWEARGPDGDWYQYEPTHWQPLQRPHD